MSTASSSATVVVVVRVRSDRARQGRTRHRRLLGQSDDPRTDLHQLRQNAATASGNRTEGLLRLHLFVLLMFQEKRRIDERLAINADVTKPGILLVSIKVGNLMTCANLGIDISMNWWEYKIGVSPLLGGLLGYTTTVLTCCCDF